MSHRHFISARIDGLNQYINKTNRDFAGHLNNEGLSRYIQSTCPQFLLSFGCVMKKGTAVKPRSFSTLRKKILRLHDNPRFAPTELSLDNGGYQIQQGFLTPPQIGNFIDGFYDFVADEELPIDWTFTLDIASGKENVFESETQVAALNDLSYRRASELGAEARARMIYVEHFRTREFLRTWRHLRASGYPQQFTEFGTGGLASSPKGMRRPPCLPFSLPLVPVLRDLKQRRVTNTRFHVLGNAQLPYFLGYSLMEEHVQRVHGVNLRIVCDSTSLFSGFVQSAQLPLVDCEFDRLRRVSVRSADLGIRLEGTRTNNAQFLRSKVDDTLVPFGMAPLSPAEIYSPCDTGYQLSTKASTYGLLLYLDTVKTVEIWCRTAAADLYPIYAAGDKPQFIHRATNFLAKLTLGGHTPIKRKNAEVFAEQCFESMKLLGALDEDYVTHIVDRDLDRSTGA